MKKYATIPSFERLSICALSVSQKLYNRLGEHIDPAQLNDPAAELLLRAVRSVTQGTGGKLPSSVVLLQAIRNWVDEGKITHEAFAEVEELVFCTEPDKDDDAYVEAWKPHLHREALKHAAERSIAAYQSGDPSALEAAARAMERAGKIGHADAGVGISFDSGLDEALESTHIEVCSSGVPDLDILLRGGPPRAALTMFLGGPNSGKSMELTTCAAANLLRGENVAIATLENPRAVQMSRVLAAMVGIPTDALSARQSDVRRFLKEVPHGSIAIEYFAPIVTKISTIRSWVNDLERENGIRYNIIIIDYTDKVGSHRQEKGEYEAQRTVCESFRDWVVQENRWGITATQAVRKQRGSPADTVLDESDVADSQHKIRIADLMISINPRAMTYYWWVIRHRLMDVNKQGVEAEHQKDICRMGVWGT